MPTNYFSDIPQGMGTSRNESLHKGLNRFLGNRSKLSSEMIFALLHSFFYMHNNKTIGKTSKESSADAVKNICISPATNFQPRIGFASRSEMQMPQTLLDEVSEIARVSKDIIAASEKMPKMPMFTREVAVISCCFKGLPNCDAGPINEQKEHYEQIDKVLREASLERIAIEGDGNCMFSTVSFSLKSMKLNQEYSTFLESMGINTTEEIASISNSLRKVVVDELMQQYEFYEKFANDLSESEYRRKVQECKKSDVFAGDIGDLILPAISNTLRISINLITSNPECPFMHMQPKDSPLSDSPLCIAYISHGPGHYDACKEMIFDEKHKQGKKQGKCTCGRKVHTSCISNLCKCFRNKVSCGADPACLCSNCENKFGTRSSQLIKKEGCRCGQGKKEEPTKKPCSSTKCPCFRTDQKCQSKCGCKFCGNGKPNAEQKNKTREVTKRSLSAKHSSKLERTSSHDFLSQNDFTTKPLGWSLNESIVLSQVIYVKAFSKPYNLKAITSLYNSVIQADQQFGTIKTKDQIKSKLAHMTKLIES